MNAWFPDRKVWVGMLAGALSGVIVWALRTRGIEVPETVERNIGEIMLGVGFFVAYWIPAPGGSWLPSTKSAGAPSVSSPGSPSPPQD